MQVRNDSRVDPRDSTIVLHTGGDGWWSNEAKDVRITDLRIGYVDDEQAFGELCVHFNTRDWDINADGLIYTDSLFMQELQDMLNGLGLCGKDVSYSEQGMQGDNYVSCDVGKPFLDSWLAVRGEGSLVWKYCWE